MPWFHYMSVVILPACPDTTLTTSLGADSSFRGLVCWPSLHLSGLPLMSSSFLSSSSTVGTGASSPLGPRDPADGQTLSILQPLGEPTTFWESHSQTKVQLLSEHSSDLFSPCLSQRNLLGPFCYCYSHSAPRGTLDQRLTPSPQFHITVTESFLLTADMFLPSLACTGVLGTSLLLRKLSAALGCLGGYHIFFH